MNENPDDQGSTLAPTFVEDLFLTDSFLIKGRLQNKSRRLTNALEDHARAFLRISDATMVALRGVEVIRTPAVQVNIEEVIFAHELLDTAGDEVQRRLALPNKTVRIRTFYNGVVQFELAGVIEPGAYEQQATGRKYFIMEQPRLRGLDLDHPELQLLNRLDYAIVRREKMSYIYDFG